MPLMNFSKLSKEEINQMPLYAYDGEFELITDEKSASSALDEINKYRVVGFDTEARPSFKKTDNFKDSLIQIATDKKVYLFRNQLFKMPTSFIDFLENKNITKAGIAIHDDVKSLRKLYPCKDHGFVDLSKIAKEKEVQNYGLRNMAAALLKVRISKGAKLTNWEAKALSEAQISYAATDAWISLQLYHALEELS
jgi:ribonuclease D